MYTSYYFLFCMKVYLDMYAEYLLIIEFNNNNIVFPFSKSPTCLILSSCVKCQMTYGISHLSLAHIIHFLFNMLRSGSADIIFFYKHVNRFNQLFFRDYTSLNISKLLVDVNLYLEPKKEFTFRSLRSENCYYVFQCHVFQQLLSRFISTCCNSSTIFTCTFSIRI